MPPEVTSTETYCPDHFGHVLTRSGYCIYGQHMPETAGTKAAKKAEGHAREAIHLVHKEAEAEPVTTELYVTAAEQHQSESEPAPFTIEGEMARYYAQVHEPVRESVQTTPGAVAKPLGFGTLGAARTNLDPATGEVATYNGVIHTAAIQLALSDIFDRYLVKTGKVTLSGSEVMPLDIAEYAGLTALEPGMVVSGHFTGVVLDVSAPFNPSTEKHAARWVIRVARVTDVAEVADGD